MNCPFCRKYFSKKELVVDHIESIHEAQLPNSMTAEQMLYYSTHGTINGRCMCGCDKPTEWNYKTGKPYRVSSNPECKKRIAQKADENNIKVYGKAKLTDDPDHQRKMANNKPISGEYTFQDGSKQTYVGSYEKKFLEFCDIVMEFDTRMIMDCPYVFNYMDGDKERFYIPDKYLPDFNLIVEIKEGGSNPNNNPEYLATTKRKEKLKHEAMRKQAQYNYIQIVDNKYGPFLKLLYELKKESISPSPNKKQRIIINEAVTMPEAESYSPNLYMILAKNKTTGSVDNVGISDTASLSYMYIPNGDKISTSSIYDNYFKNKDVEIHKFIGDSEKAENVFKQFKGDPIECVNEAAIIKMFDILTECDVKFNMDAFVKNNTESNEFVKLFEINDVNLYKKQALNYLMER